MRRPCSRTRLPAEGGPISSEMHADPGQHHDVHGRVRIEQNMCWTGFDATVGGIADADVPDALDADGQA